MNKLTRVVDAERLLEAIGTLLLEGQRPAEELWPITAFSLAAHARSHHRALLHGLAGPGPRASKIHARPIVETAILIDYLAEIPDVRIWAWVADGLNEQLKMLREWREAVERGDNDHASFEDLTALIHRKATQRDEARAEAKKVAADRGIELTTVELPSMRSQAERKPKLLDLYTEAFRHLSSSVHVAASLFTEDRYGEAMSLLDDSLEDDDRIAIRALAAAVLAVVYADAARALQQGDLAERTEAVHSALVTRSE